jgi:hypothetical protein
MRRVKRARDLVVVALFGAAAACGSTEEAGAPASGSGGTSETGASSAATAGGAGGRGAGGGGAGGQAIDYCAACAAPVQVGALSAPALIEASGLAASAVHAGVYYAQNDSGNAASVFAFDVRGADQGEYRLTGTNNVDWEDLARGPCPAGSCIYVGDIGDNDQVRPSYVVYRFAEPRTLATGAHDVTPERLPFRYPDGSHNAETLLLDPVTSEMAIVTKSAAGARLYVFPKPLTPGVEMVLEDKGAITPPRGLALVTGGSVHPGSRGVLLRTYTGVFFYPKSEGQTLADALTGTACALPAADEPQGETVAWTAQGEGYLTVSEGGSAPIWSVSCGR